MLRHHSQLFEDLLYCVYQRWSVLLIGDESVGKSYLIRTVASMLKKNVYEYSMNNSSDTNELLGCFEQLEITRHISIYIHKLQEYLNNLVSSILSLYCNEFYERYHGINTLVDSEERNESNKRRKRYNSSTNTVVSSPIEVTEQEDLYYSILVQLNQFLAQLNQFLVQLSMSSTNVSDSDSNEYNSKVIEYLQKILDYIQATSILQSMKQQYKSTYDDLSADYSTLRVLNEKKIKGSFEWIDSSLIDAITNGYWVILDNVNFCNANILDRLNSLLEPNGVLVMSECGPVNGKTRIIVPHPNFRLFLVMNPKYGEISRAMRNRCVEIYVPSYSEDETDTIQETEASQETRLMNSNLLCDEYDIIRCLGIRNHDVIFAIINLHHTIQRLCQKNHYLVNERYLKRFVHLLVIQIERGHSIDSIFFSSLEQIYPSSVLNEISELIHKYIVLFKSMKNQRCSYAPFFTSEEKYNYEEKHVCFIVLNVMDYRFICYITC